jgi:hypothetical protein
MRRFESELKKLVDSLQHEGSGDWSFTFQNYREARNEYRELIKSRRLFNSYYQRKTLQFEVDYMNFMCEKNSQLALVLDDYFFRSEKAQADYGQDTFSYKAIRELTNIFIVIANNSFAMRNLVLGGLDFQAKVIFRNTIELTELCMCVLQEETFLDFFREEIVNERSEPVYKSIKYQSIKKTTNQVIEFVKTQTKGTLPPEFWEDFLRTRAGFYEDSASHVHANFMSIALGGHVHDIDDDSRVLLNVGGLVNRSTKNVVKQILIYDSISYMVILILMINKHELFFKKFNRGYDYLTVLSKTNWDMLRLLF